MVVRDKAPIDRLEPGSRFHDKLLPYVVDRIEASERAMSEFYPRWQVNERKMQAYISLPDYQKMLDEMNARGEAPRITQIIIPYSFAVIQTIVTYLLHTYCGRQPIFQVSSYNGDLAQNAKNLEIVMQYNCDHNRFPWQLYQALLNAQIYQIGIIRVGWKESRRERTTWGHTGIWGMLGNLIGTKMVPTRQLQLVYSGNELASIDPFCFFPDPNFAMTEVSRRGEYVFWRSYCGEMTLREEAAAGRYRHVEYARQTTAENRWGNENSDRALRSMGTPIAGSDRHRDDKTSKMFQIDEGSILLVPADFGLSEKETPEKWLVTIVNKKQIVRAEPLEADHDMHPVAIIEPNSISSQFGSLAITDIVGPIQDLLSWLVNSHMQNVRTVINNKIVVNPHYVEMQDLAKDPNEHDDAWIVRMKQSAFGLKPEDGIYQLQVQDVTQGHMANIAQIMRFGDMLAGVNSNLMGIQTPGGRKTATEVRTSGEAGASRLAAMARLISSHGMVDLATMMGTNLQQRMNPEFYMKLLGKKGQEHPINPMTIAGDFYYPMNDGTLPLDRAALLQVWKDIMMGVAQDPELRQTYSLAKMFAFVADLGGARNIDSFKVTAVPDAALGQQVQAGNVVPMPTQAPTPTLPVAAGQMA